MVRGRSRGSVCRTRGLGIRRLIAMKTSIWDGLYGPVDVRRVQPYEATKDYVCPG